MFFIPFGYEVAQSVARYLIHQPCEGYVLVPNSFFAKSLQQALLRLTREDHKVRSIPKIINLEGLDTVVLALSLGLNLPAHTFFKYHERLLRLVSFFADKTSETVISHAIKKATFYGNLGQEFMKDGAGSLLMYSQHHKSWLDNSTLESLGLKDFQDALHAGFFDQDTWIYHVLSELERYIACQGLPVPITLIMTPPYSSVSLAKALDKDPLGQVICIEDMNNISKEFQDIDACVIPYICCIQDKQNPVYSEFLTLEHEATYVASLIREHMKPKVSIAVVTDDSFFIEHLKRVLLCEGLMSPQSVSVPFSQTLAGQAIQKTCHLLSEPSLRSLLMLFEVGHCPQNLEARKLIFQKTVNLQEILPKKVEGAHSIQYWIMRHQSLLKDRGYLSDDETLEEIDRYFQVLSTHLVDVVCVSEEYTMLCEFLIKIYPSLVPRKPSPVEFISSAHAVSFVGDVVILASLSEGVWGRKGQDWLSTTVRDALNLPNSETQSNLGEARFLRAMEGRIVYLTRHRLEDGRELDPFWGLEKIRSELVVKEAPSTLSMVARRYDKRPEPRPLAIYRPKRLSISDMGLLIRDPYGFYAKKILKLTPFLLDPDTSQPFYKGQMIHNIVHKALSDPMYEAKSTDERQRILRDKWRQKIDEQSISQTSCVFWTQEFDHIAQWFSRSPLEGAYVCEHKGNYRFMLGADIFHIHGIADRIDWNEGKLWIIDYKTGALPSRRDIESAYHPQLFLEALMAWKKGFGLAKPSEVIVQLWHLKGTSSRISFTKTMDEELCNQAEHTLKRFLSYYGETKIPYVSLESKRSIFREYYHLERFDYGCRF